MRIVELHAEGWATAMDFVNALKEAIGAPDWHGQSPDAFRRHTRRFVRKLRFKGGPRVIQSPREQKPEINN